MALEINKKMSSKGKYCERAKLCSYKWRLDNKEKWKELKRLSYIRNKESACKRSREWYAKNRTRCKALSRIRYIKNEYGISEQQYNEMVSLHEGKCAICASAFKNAIDRHTDHSHKTEKVRGLLCTACNVALGSVEKQNGAWLPKAIEYLQKHNEPGFDTWRWK